MDIKERFDKDFKDSVLFLVKFNEFYNKINGETGRFVRKLTFVSDDMMKDINARCSAIDKGKYDSYFCIKLYDCSINNGECVYVYPVSKLNRHNYYLSNLGGYEAVPDCSVCLYFSHSVATPVLELYSNLDVAFDAIKTEFKL